MWTPPSVVPALTIIYSWPLIMYSSTTLMRPFHKHIASTRLMCFVLLVLLVGVLLHLGQPHVTVHSAIVHISVIIDFISFLLILFKVGRPGGTRPHNTRQIGYVFCW